MEIFVEGLEFVGAHGVYEEERVEGRRFRVDFLVQTSRDQSSASDDLEETIDYRELEAMTNRLELLLSKAVDAGVRQVIHVSSVAVVDHVKDQREFTEANPLPSIDAYTGPYDIFKRVSEDIVGRVCRKRNVAFTNLRLGGIYSSSRGCIQMSSLRGQARIGIYFPNGMDLNSSRNASIAMMISFHIVRDGRIELN